MLEQIMVLVNTSGGLHVAWCWNAGGSTVTRFMTDQFQSHSKSKCKLSGFSISLHTTGNNWE